MEIEEIKSVNASEGEESEDEVKNLSTEAKEKLVPEKSNKLYQQAYCIYRRWLQTTKYSSTTKDTVLAYFNYLSKKNAPSTCWTTFSKLKSLIKLKENINIGTYYDVIAFLKQNKKGYKPKQSEISTSEQVKDFILHAPDELFLDVKVKFHFIFLNVLLIFRI